MKSKGYLLATASSVAAAGVMTGGAQAADMAVHKAPPPAPVVAPPLWTGLYVGIHAGASWQLSQADYSSEVTAPSGASGVGFIGGGQIGYNWQFAPAWVLGFEADLSGLAGKAESSSPFSGKGPTTSSQITWLSTLRGRGGWLIDPETLLYATGGVAWGHVKDSFNPFGFATGFGPAFTTKSASTTKTGWVWGGGIEHMLGGAWSHWTIGLEGLYVGLGTSVGRNAAGTGKSSQFKNSVAIARLKLNYKF